MIKAEKYYLRNKAILSRIKAKWDFEKNTKNINDRILITKDIVWWKCEKGHSFSSTIKQALRNNGKCPFCNESKIIEGFNDLKTKFPKILSQWDFEKNVILPNKIGASSKKVVWWKCEKGHSYNMQIYKKVKRGFGCPICSNYRVLPGFNDLATTNPDLCEEWNYEKNKKFLPTQITYGSGKKVWWKCEKGHEWIATPHDRTSYHTGCPVCSKGFSTSLPEQTIYYYFKKIFPDAINRYKGIENNIELDIYIPSQQLAIEYDGAHYHRSEIDYKKELNKFLICKKHNIYLIRIKENHDNIWKDTAHQTFVVRKNDESALKTIIQYLIDSYDKEYHYKYLSKHLFSLNKNNDENNLLSIEHSDTVVDIQKDFKKIISYKNEIKNSLLITHPNLAKKWDFERNAPLKPSMISYGSNMKVWWICENCSTSFQKSINRHNYNTPVLCPTCSKKYRGIKFTQNRVKKVGSLKETHPHLALEFHPTKNEGIKIDTITASRFKPVWWLCSKCGYEWMASPNNRKNGIGCPHCCGRVPKIGVDDLLTVNPSLCKYWNYKKT